jgi:hypothetical protein
MIKYTDILTSVNTVLDNHFPTIEIQSNDVSEGFNRPSFFVKFDNISKSSSLEHFNRSMTVRIYYFPSDINNNSLELLETQEILESAFDLKLEVLDRFLNIEDVNIDTVDGVLHCYFDIQYSDTKDIQDDSELMNSLELKRG